MSQVACGSGDSQPAAGSPGGASASAPSAPAGPSGASGASGSSGSPGMAAWSFVERHNTCEALEPQRCQGFYGFRVLADGHFRAGPGPNGELFNGEITQAERASLDAGVTAVTANDDGMSTCEDSASIPGVTDRDDVGFEDGTSYTAYSQNGFQTCWRGGAKARAQALDGDLGTLMRKYYPTTFPNP